MALPNPRPHPEWKLLIPHTKDMEYGSMVSYDQMEEWSGLQRTEGRFRSMVARWKKEMQNEYHRTMRVVQKQGFRALTVPELGPHMKHLGRLGNHTIRKAVRVGEHADYANMADKDRHHLINLTTRIAMVHQLNREKFREMPALPGQNGDGPASPRMLKEKPKDKN